MSERSYRHQDGFSTVAPVLFGFDREIDERTLSGPSNLTRTTTLEGGSTTWLIRKDTVRNLSLTYFSRFRPLTPLQYRLLSVG
jgi:hypothetical protein